jgi:surface protein
VFHTSAFNQDVSKWNTGAVTSMTQSKCTLSRFEYMYTCTTTSSFIGSQVSHGLLFFLIKVFLNSGFKRTLCGGQWQSLSSNSYLTSTGRLGCCPIGSFMSNPFVAFSVDESCTACPSNALTTIANDDISCTNNVCPTGMVYLDTFYGCVVKILPNGDGSFSATGNAGSLRRAVFEWIAGGGTYGPIEDWDVSEVTNMKYVFTGYQTASTFGSFNADLSKWNMAAVTNMEASKCTPLSPSQWPRRLPLWCVVEYIRKLDVRRVTILTRIVIFVVFLKRYTLFCCLWWVGLSFLCGTLSLVVFESAFAFNSDVSKWITGAVTTMQGSKCTFSPFVDYTTN